MRVVWGQRERREVGWGGGGREEREESVQEGLRAGAEHGNHAGGLGAEGGGIGGREGVSRAQHALAQEDAKSNEEQEGERTPHLHVVHTVFYFLVYAILL